MNLLFLHITWLKTVLTCLLITFSSLASLFLSHFSLIFLSHYLYDGLLLTETIMACLECAKNDILQYDNLLICAFSPSLYFILIIIVTFSNQLLFKIA
jgi:hypothetical protein